MLSSVVDCPGYIKHLHKAVVVWQSGLFKRKCSRKKEIEYIQVQWTPEKSISSVERNQTRLAGKCWWRERKTTWILCNKFGPIRKFLRCIGHKTMVKRFKFSFKFTWTVLSSSKSNQNRNFYIGACTFAVMHNNANLGPNHLFVLGGQILCSFCDYSASRWCNYRGCTVLTTFDWKWSKENQFRKCQI